MNFVSLQFFFCWQDVELSEFLLVLHLFSSYISELDSCDVLWACKHLRSRLRGGNIYCLGKLVKIYTDLRF